MPDGGWTRKMLLTALVCGLFCMPLMIPTAAGAQMFSAPADFLTLGRPTSLNSATFKAKAYWWGYGSKAPVGSVTFRGNKRRITLLVQRKTPAGDLHWKKVGYTTFKKYVRVDRASVASVDYTWRKDSAGKRYRYARKIWVSNYGEF